MMHLSEYFSDAPSPGKPVQRDRCVTQKDEGEGTGEQTTTVWESIAGPTPPSSPPASHIDAAYQEDPH